MSGDTLQIFSEFLGTLILVLLGNGVVAAVSLEKSKAQGAGWVVITLGWGAAVTIAVYASSFMGPAHLNPAVTLGMAVAGNIGWNLVVLLEQLLYGLPICHTGKQQKTKQLFWELLQQDQLLEVHLLI
jgi:glycerol uptake facilitator protein